MECKLINIIKGRQVMAPSMGADFTYCSCVLIVDFDKGNTGWGTGEYNISLNIGPYYSK